ncbi:MAG: hypothetical protein REI78_11345 [Pedobacter sp.]|nr:hypothetical protein [Pedobacter sp.]MDQ8053616.1 hypothetical protein [Pedobacter sp.]
MKFYDKFHPDGYYHLFNHAVGFDNLFRSHDNYLFFLARYEKYIYPVAKTFVYCLMPNHFHFLIQIRNEESIRQLAKVDQSVEFDFHRFMMQYLSNFLNSYAKAFNKQHKRKGALFIDFTKRIEIKNETYFNRIIHYIHLNPVHHGFVASVNDWKYSSYHSIIDPQGALKLEREAILEWFGGIAAFVEFHQTALLLEATYEIEC